MLFKMPLYKFKTLDLNSKIPIQAQESRCKFKNLDLNSKILI